MAPEYSLHDMGDLDKRVRELEEQMAGVRARMTVIVGMLGANLAGIVALLLDAHK